MILLLTTFLIFNSAGATHTTEMPLLNPKHVTTMPEALKLILPEAPPVKLTPHVKNRVGQVYGKLRVLYFSGVRDTQAYWVCQCECGNLKELRGRAMHDGGTISCGCWIKGVHTHGGCVNNLTEYRILSRIIDRCSNPRNKVYRHYGGRGITVCAEWNHLSKFEVFFEHVGPRPANRSCLGRIDNNRGYEPGNVAWTSWVFENRNKRSNRVLSYKGVKACVAEWAQLLGIGEATLRQRLRLGWTLERTLETPLKPISHRKRLTNGTFATA